MIKITKIKRRQKWPDTGNYERRIGGLAKGMKFS